MISALVIITGCVLSAMFAFCVALYWERLRVDVRMDLIWRSAYEAGEKTGYKRGYDAGYGAPVRRKMTES